MASRIVTSLLLSLTIFISSCGGNAVMNLLPSTPIVKAQSPTDPNAIFQGRYWFHSKGVGMFENGVITADGHGHFTLHSMYANDNLNHSINTAGFYSLTSAGSGTAGQGQCLATDQSCPGDREALFVSSDGNRMMMVSTEGPGQQWALEADRDPAPFISDLSTCDARSGSVLNCNDGWITPAGWF